MNEKALFPKMELLPMASFGCAAGMHSATDRRDDRR